MVTNGLKINGFGESSTGGVTAGIEMTSAASGTSQAVSSCSETGNIATYTITTPPLNSAFQPPAYVYLAGTYTPSGFGGGPYKVINTNYVRSAGTFSVILPVTGLGSSCSAAGTVNTTTSNNTFGDINITMPSGQYGGLTSTLFGIQLRPTATGSYMSNNRFNNITLLGTPGASITEDGISLQSTGSGAIEDSNVFSNIGLTNFTNGLNIVAGTTHYFRNIDFGTGITTNANVSGSPTFAETDFPVPFGDLTGVQVGKTAIINNDSATPGFGATCNASGSAKVKCWWNGTNWTVVSQ
jgi:hypothetical protein